MNREEKIMKRLQEHYDYVESLGYNVVALFLQGSQNYELDIYTDEYMSDVDTKSIVLPTLDDLVAGNKMTSTTYDIQGEHSIEHAEVKDIRIMMDMWVKENTSYLELLFTDFKIINPLYKEFVDEILSMNNDILKINIPQFLKCVSGMSMEKVKALYHPYPGTMDKIEKFGYDPKQLHHIIRLNWFLNTLIENDFSDYKSALVPNNEQKAYLIRVKKGEEYDLQQAITFANAYDNDTKLLKDELINGKYQDYEFQTETYEKLQSIVSECVKFNIIYQVRKDLEDAKDSL